MNYLCCLYLSYSFYFLYNYLYFLSYYIPPLPHASEGEEFEDEAKFYKRSSRNWLDDNRLSWNKFLAGIRKDFTKFVEDKAWMAWDQADED